MPRSCPAITPGDEVVKKMVGMLLLVIGGIVAVAFLGLGLHLGLGLSLREHLDTLTAAVARQVRQRLQGRPGGGESFQELIKHDWTDVVRSDQAQPVQLFGVGKRLRAGFVFVGHSGRGWSRFSGGVKGMRLYGKVFLLCSITGKGCLARGNCDGALIKK